MSSFIAPWLSAPTRQPLRTFVGRITAAFVAAAAVGAGALTTAASAAQSHDDPCHLQHTCPSDDASYIWFEQRDMWTAYGWWCLDPASPKYNPVDYTRAFQHDNRAYVCESAGVVVIADFAPVI